MPINVANSVNPGFSGLTGYVTGQDARERRDVARLREKKQYEEQQAFRQQQEANKMDMFDEEMSTRVDQNRLNREQQITLQDNAYNQRLGEMDYRQNAQVIADDMRYSTAQERELEGIKQREKGIMSSPLLTPTEKKEALKQIEREKLGIRPTQKMLSPEEQIYTDPKTGISFLRDPKTGGLGQQLQISQKREEKPAFSPKEKVESILKIYQSLLAGDSKATWKQAEDIFNRYSGVGGAGETPAPQRMPGVEGGQGTQITSADLPIEEKVEKFFNKRDESMSELGDALNKNLKSGNRKGSDLILVATNKDESPPKSIEEEKAILRDTKTALETSLSKNIKEISAWASPEDIKSLEDTVKYFNWYTDEVIKLKESLQKEKDPKKKEKIKNEIFDKVEKMKGFPRLYNDKVKDIYRRKK